MRYRSFITVLFFFLAVCAVPATTMAANFQEVFFLHHSVGDDLIIRGNVRPMFTAAGFNFWDHGYNYEGLRDPSGNFSGSNFNISDDNTDPEGLYNLFQEINLSDPNQALSRIMAYDVVIFKSCYPASAIYDTEMLNQYKRYYLSIRNFMDNHRDKIFIPFTTPPMNPPVTNATEAANARAFANWLTSSEYTSGHPNVYPFNFFNLLADSSNFLRTEYRLDAEDSHPSEFADRTIGPIFVNHVIDAINDYRSSGDGPGLSFSLILNASSYSAGDIFALSMACSGYVSEMDLYLLLVTQEGSIINCADGLVITARDTILPFQEWVYAANGGWELFSFEVPSGILPSTYTICGVLIPQGADIYQLGGWLAVDSVDAVFE